MEANARGASFEKACSLGSRTTSSAITSMATLIILFAFARVVFGVRIQGSMLGFLGVCAAFSLMTATFGLLIATLGRTAEATRGLAILATLLMVMLGGAWVPTFVFPKWLRTVTVVFPTRWAMDGLDAGDVARPGLFGGSSLHRPAVRMRVGVRRDRGDAFPLGSGLNLFQGYRGPRLDSRGGASFQLAGDAFRLAFLNVVFRIRKKIIWKAEAKALGAS